MSEKLHLLLVDDDSFIAQLVTLVLAADFDIRHVEDGYQALASVVAHQPDVVLLDMVMPGLSGVEVCREMRKLPALKHTPIIFFSGNPDESERRSGFDAGGDAFIAKPVVPGTLRAQLSQALQDVARRLAAEVTADLPH
ncbi:MAG: response regulator [Gammaproteobacteria bacterium]|nr:response regulator [Gammaproteobacteria bacterium]